MDDSDEFPLSEIPRHLQLEVLKKMEFPEFRVFQQCSKSAFQLSQNVKTRLPWYVDHLGQKELMRMLQKADSSQCPMRMLLGVVIFNHEVNNRRIENLSLLLEKTNSRIYSVEVTFLAFWAREFSEDSLVRLCKASSASKLDIYNCEFFEGLFEEPYIQQMEWVEFFKGDHTDVDDFTLLKADLISLAQLPRIPETLQRLSLFFEQWTKRERRIETFRCFWNGTKEEFMGCLSGLRLQSIWTPAIHRRTPLRSVRLFNYNTSPSDETFLCSRDDGALLIIVIADHKVWALEVKDLNEAFFQLKYIFKFDVSPSRARILIRSVMSAIRDTFWCLGCF